MQRLKSLLPLLALILLFALPAQAKKPSEMSKAEREQWFSEMRQLKHDFLERELGLSDEQKTRFFALYDAKEEERRSAYREVRQAEKALKKKGNAATEADYEHVAALKFELRGKENAIEMKYYEQFKQVLSAKQLYKLKEAEQEFDKFIREQHRKHHKK